jgi:hypothetical protein
MKIFHLSARFYILFTLILLAPTAYLANNILNFTDYLSQRNGYIADLINNGVLQLPTTLILLLLFFYIFNNWLWKIPPLTKLFGIPLISGRYLGKLESSYAENNMHNIVIEIKQTLTRIKICLFAEKSRSVSLICSLFKNELGAWSLYYIYKNKTRAMGNDVDMNDHEGVAVIDIHGKKLNGYYFNDPRNRKRSGVFNVELASKKLLKDYI